MTQTKEERQQVAQTIAVQLNGRGLGRLKTMIGATNFVALDEELGGLKFDFKSCKGRKANKCQIILNYDDTYTMEFYKLNKKTYECPLVKRFEGLYCDMIQNVFEQYTELYLTL